MATKPIPTPDELRQLLNYDPDTGLFTWKIRDAKWFKNPKYAKNWNTRWAGTPALGAIHFRSRGVAGGYKSGNILGNVYLSHRVAWAHHYGEWPEQIIDHVNRDTSDNRICNLREANHTQSAANRATPSSNTSGFKGVSKVSGSGKWRVTFSIGTFDTIDDAKNAYKKYHSMIYGEFACFD